MVQYVFTPWRDRSELLMVRRQFYPTRTQLTRQPHHQSSSLSPPPQEFTFFTPSQSEAASRAVARVSCWMQRENCPHLIESTALLVAAILDDQRQSSSSSPFACLDSGSGYAVRAAYSAAFSRFVTGLLDSQQNTVRKMSMYDLAKSVGLPATFVELRHQATHEELPLVFTLRIAAGRALDWIWENYWTRLVTEEEDDDIDMDGGDGQLLGEVRLGAAPKRTPSVFDSGQSKRRKVDTSTVKEEKDGALQQELSRRLAVDDVMVDDLGDELTIFGKKKVMDALERITNSAINPRILRRAMTLTAALTMETGLDDMVGEAEGMEEDEGTAAEDRVGEQVKQGGGLEENMGKQKEELLSPSWSLYEEAEWIPKPIGVACHRSVFSLQMQ